uniref:BET1-like protein n=2 Tax=Scolopacidae TaxID=8917 RepID=A0A8C3J9E4_9CHAR
MVPNYERPCWTQGPVPRGAPGNPPHPNTGFWGTKGRSGSQKAVGPAGCRAGAGDTGPNPPRSWGKKRRWQRCSYPPPPPAPPHATTSFPCHFLHPSKPLQPVVWPQRAAGRYLRLLSGSEAAEAGGGRALPRPGSGAAGGPGRAAPVPSSRRPGSRPHFLAAAPALPRQRAAGPPPSARGRAGPEGSRCPPRPPGTGGPRRGGAWWKRRTFKGGGGRRGSARRGGAGAAMAEWGRGQSPGAVEDVLDVENKRMADSLASKVTRLKSLALDIDKDAEEQNRYLDGMDSDFMSVTGLLTGSVKRFSTMTRSGRDNRKLLCSVSVGLIVIFFILYYLVSKAGT